MLGEPNIHLPPHESFYPTATPKELFTNNSNYKTWLCSIQESLSTHNRLLTDPNAHYHLTDVAFRCVNEDKKNNIGFIQLAATIKNNEPEAPPLKKWVYIRGGAVAILVILRPKMPRYPGEKYFVLTQQPRPAAGTLSMVELCAGKIDKGGLTAEDVAKDELEEELHLPVTGRLVDLTKHVTPLCEAEKEAGLKEGAYSSPGGQDEWIKFFLYEKRVERTKIDEFRGKETGLREQGELITTRCVPRHEFLKEAGRDMKALSAWALYKEYKKSVRVPGLPIRKPSLWRLKVQKWCCEAKCC